MDNTSEPETQAAEPAADRVLVLLCTYNEAENVPRMVALLHDVLPAADILVVDDNSPDGTGRWVSEKAAVDSRLHLLHRGSKQGLGTALRAGMGWCLQRDYDFLINLDADLSHRPVDAPAMLAACRRASEGQANCDVAIGSRYLPGGGFIGLAWHRRLLSRTLNAYATRLLRLPLTDCSGSYRCYRVESLRGLDLSRLKCAGYGFLEEILVLMHRGGARFCEVPILFEARSSGRSKLSLSDALGAFRVIHRLAFAARN